MTPILIAILLFLSYFLYNKVETTDTKQQNIEKVDSLKHKTDTIYVEVHDTIWKIGKAKEKVEAEYSDKIEKLPSTNDTSSLKKLFNSTFTRDGDTTSTPVAYTQVKKTLVVNEKFNRDSTLLHLTNSQLSLCTLGLTKLKNTSDSSLDSAKKLIIKSYDDGYSKGSYNNKKNLLYGGLGIFVLGFLGGHFF